MKEFCNEVKTSVYAGMSIFYLIKDSELSIKEKEISLEDKKYLSLYLGILNTKNNISTYLKEKNINFNVLISFKYLKNEQYLDLYDKYFVSIIDEINFKSIEEHFSALLNKKIVQDFNRCNGHYVEQTISDRNKQLVNTIK